MSEHLRQLDEILAMAESEYAALLDGDINTVEILCERRDALMRQTMHDAANMPQQALHDKLLALQHIQQKLRDEAARQREELRAQIFQTKRETKRMNAYHQSMLIASS